MAIAPSQDKEEREPYGVIGSPARGFIAYRLSRRLETFAVAVTPEQIGVLEGLRAATAVAAVVGAALWLHWPNLSWAAFGAFWTCLADPGGPYRIRLLAMAGFAVAGAIAAWIASASAGASPALAGIFLLPLIFFPSLGGTYGPAAGQVGLLVSVVAVVAIAYPHDPRAALTPAGLFFLGCLWAIILCLALWRLHPHAPARRAIASVLVRLSDMAFELLALDRLRDRAASSTWYEINAEHRRSVRGALERTRSIVTALETGRTHYGRELELTDRVFAGLIAVGYELEEAHDEAGSPTEQTCLGSVAHLLREAAGQAAQRTPDVASLSSELLQLQAVSFTLPGVMGRALGAATTALAGLRDTLTQRASILEKPAASTAPGAIRAFRPVRPIMLRHAARVTIAVAVSYVVATQIHLAFSYWATVATVVVLQPGATATWPRSLERMAGSIAGGFLVAGILAVQPNQWALLAMIFPLAAATIALRAVNYSAYVFFLTPLFILVIELLQPAAGLPLARGVNNVIGSLVGAAASTLLWPASNAWATGAVLAAAVKANLAFTAAAVGGCEISPELECLRRKAGMTSSTADAMRHRMMLEGQWRRAHLAEMGAILVALRRLAGAATVLTLASRAPDHGRAFALAHMANRLATQVRHPTPDVVSHEPADTPHDGVDRAIGAVVAAIEAYAAAFNSRSRRGRL